MIQIKAAARLQAFTVPMAQRPARIQEMMKRAGVDENTAKSYLEGHDWNVDQALWWYKADQKHAKTSASQRLGAAPSSMSNADLMKKMVDSVSRLMDWAMDDMGWDYEKALKHAKGKSTAGSAVWDIIAKKYKSR